MDELQIRALIEEVVKSEIQKNFGVGKFILEKELQMMDGRNVQLGRTTGTKIGTETTQKLSFFGVTPVAQQATISDPSGGGTVDTNARTAINTIIDRLQAFGLIA
jgi:hypothetical protein